MPEGDALHRTAAGLRPHLVGRVVTEARTGGPGAIPRIEHVVGRTVTEVVSVGKHLLAPHVLVSGVPERKRPGRERSAAGRARMMRGDV